jgi:integrase
MELIILLSVGAVMVAATMAFSLALKRTSGFLFHDVNGNSLSQTNLLRRGLRPALKKLGQPKAGFHAFRRFRTTWLRKNRTPEDLIRFWLGQADETVTDGYSKLRDDL